MIPMGMKARDRITGFAGIVTGQVSYITGCNQILLSPSVDEKGGARSAEWFDSQRVEQIGTEQIILDNSQANGPDKAAPIR